MKKTLGLAVLATLAGAAMASAATVSVSYVPFQSGQGGEFRIIEVGQGAGISGLFSDITAAHPYGQSASLAGENDFQTFCIERSESVGQTTYSYQVESGARLGGRSGGPLDVIDYRTGYLYSKFRYGTLSGYNYNVVSGDESAREASARTLQTAIWFIEQELNLGASAGTNVYATLPANVPGEFDNNPNNLNQTQWDQVRAWVLEAQNAANIDYCVRALNLFIDGNGNGVYDTGETLAQSQLTLVPLPTAALSSMAGILGLACIRRRSAK